MAYNELIGTLGEQSAAWYKEECRRYAEAAEQSATDAGNSATAAERDAGIASDKADIATNKANLAGESADLAQEWAIKTDGMVGGIDYSAKHYAGQASGSATTASNKADEASTSAANAEKWASYTNGTVDGTNYSAKQYALNAGNSATTASTKAGEASDSAQTASDKAGIATTQAGLAAGSALSASNSATLAEAWATKMDGQVDGDYSAKYYAGQASTSATNAGTSETNAGNSALLAKDWATKMDGMVDGSEYSSKYYAGQAGGSATAAAGSAADAQASADYIEDEAVKIDTTEKRVSNIEKLLQGNLYDYQTDSDSKYTKTVPNGAMPYASLEQIGGRTLVWNQLQATPTGTSAVTIQGINFYISNGELFISGTAEEDGTFQIVPSANGGQSVPANHKLLFTRSGSGSFLWSREGFGTFSNDPTQDWGFSQHTADFYVAIRIHIKSGTTYNVSHMKFNVFDLTSLYGAGNEPTTVAEFKRTFPAVWYAYNPGTLLSAGVTEVKSVGKNLADYSGGRGYPSDTTGSASTKRTFTIGTYVAGLTANNYYQPDRIGNLALTDGVFSYSSIYGFAGVSFPFFAIPNTQYTFSVNVIQGNNNYQLSYAWYQQDGTFISYSVSDNVTSKTATAPSNAYYGVCFFAKHSGNSTEETFRFSNPQIEVGSTATPYAPYKSNTYPIPASVQALEGYGWSAGNVREGEAYNYIDYERKVFVQNVGKVTVTSADVPSADSGYISSGVFNSGDYVGHAYTSIRNFKYSTGGTFATLDRYVGYPAVAPFCHEIHINDKSFISSQYRTYFIDIADRDTLLAKIGAGVDMYYELQTPIEVDISAYITDDNLISVESGGTLTFPNSNGDDYRIDVPSSETYMVDLQEAI